MVRNICGPEGLARWAQSHGNERVRVGRGKERARSERAGRGPEFSRGVRGEREAHVFAKREFDSEWEVVTVQTRGNVFVAGADWGGVDPRRSN